MTSPAYHLRPNKAVDRLSFIEAIRFLGQLGNLSEYTYYCLGGPYLEDCRLLYEFYPEIKMVSVEKDAEVYKRQAFHLPCGTIQLKPTELKSFIAQYEPKDQKSIFWLDYTALEYGHFQDFMALIGKVAAKSMIKITLRAAPRDYRKKEEEFRQRFEALMPNPSATPPVRSDDFAFLVQQMVRIAAQKALPAEMSHEFQPCRVFSLFRRNEHVQSDRRGVSESGTGKNEAHFQRPSIPQSRLAEAQEHRLADS